MTANKIDSNVVGLSIAEEQTIGVLPVTPIWYGREPNSFGDFGADVKSIARQPITNTRQQEKGAVVDLDAAGNWPEDFTQNNMMRLLQGFFFANAHEKGDTAKLNGASATVTGANTTGFTGTGFIANFPVGTLLCSSGFAIPSNNGIFYAGTVINNLITATPSPTLESSPPSSARLIAVGVQFVAGDASLGFANGTNIKLTTTAYDLTTIGLSVGEWVYIGDDDTANNVFAAGGQGYARILSIGAHSIIFDESTMAGVVSSPAGKTIRMYFGKFIRNEALPANQVRRTYTVERQVGDNGTGTQGEYLIGAVPNQFKFDFPTADKVTCDLSFVAQDVQYTTGTAGLKSGTRVAVVGEAPYNTSKDIYRAKMYVIDPAVVLDPALFTFITKADVTINNNVSPTKALGELGSFDMTAGMFEVSGTITAYFTDVAAIAAVRTNADVGINIISAHTKTGWILDLPLVTIGGGKLAIEKDKPIMLDISQIAVANANNYTAQINYFPYLPNLAMPT